MMALLEVCANSIASCIAAQKGGAGRIELCASLETGGVTPSAGMLKVAKESVEIPVYPIIRARSGDFLYSASEIKQMVEDILYLRELGADGFVVGALTPDGKLDLEVCRELVQAAEGLPVTLHRAFDMSLDLSQSLEDAVGLGFSRILTSGGKQTADEGIHVIKELVRQAGDRIIIMAGSGISSENAQNIMTETGVRELHGSFQSAYPSGMLFQNIGVSMGDEDSFDEYSYMMTDVQKVRKTVEVL